MKTLIDRNSFLDNAPLMPCDSRGGYNIERTGRHRYCLTLAAPGFDEDDVEVTAENGFLRIRGRAPFVDWSGEILHRELDDTLDRSFMMLVPLEVTTVELRCGLLRVHMCERPDAGAIAARPLRLDALDAIALAA